MKSFPFPQPKTAEPGPGKAGRTGLPHRWVGCLVVLLLSSSLFAQQVQLLWDPSTEATGYNVYRNSSGNPTLSDKIMSSPVPLPTTTTPFADTAVASGQSYFYAVTAINANGESGFSNIVRADVPASDVLPPPSGFTATCASDAKSVTVSWQPVTGATSYYLRFQDANGVYAGYDQYVPTSKVEPVTPGLSYNTWVHAYSPTAGTYNANWGPGIGPSTQISFTCTAVPPPPTNLQIVFASPANGAVISWNKQTTVKLQGQGASKLYLYIDNLTTYQIFANGNVLIYRWRPGTIGPHVLKGIAMNAASQSVSTQITVTAQ